MVPRHKTPKIKCIIKLVSPVIYKIYVLVSEILNIEERSFSLTGAGWPMVGHFDTMIYSFFQFFSIRVARSSLSATITFKIQLLYYYIIIKFKIIQKKVWNYSHWLYFMIWQELNFFHLHLDGLSFSATLWIPKSPSSPKVNRFFFWVTIFRFENA